jgi:hypothetical protein
MRTCGCGSLGGKLCGFRDESSRRGPCSSQRLRGLALDVGAGLRGYRGSLSTVTGLLLRVGSVTAGTEHLKL